MAKRKQIAYDLMDGIPLLTAREEKQLLGREALSGVTGDKSTGKSVYVIINELVMEKMKADDLFWRKPWSSVKLNMRPTNYVSKAPYKGVNFFLLAYLYMRDNPYWLTFKQVEDRKGTVKKGAKTAIVTYYTLYCKDTKKNKGISEKEYEERRKKGDPDVVAFPTLKYYRVVNGDDIEGIDWKLPKPEARTDAEKIESAEAIVEGMPGRPPIRFGGDRAYYSPGEDYVQMPDMAVFHSDYEYYSTLFHELSHSTKHPSRLGESETRKGGKRFGDAAYAQEELVAELSACYLTGEAGFLYQTINNSAAYLKSWQAGLVKMLEEHEKAFVQACGEAIKSTEFILGQSPGNAGHVTNLQIRETVQNAIATMRNRAAIRYDIAANELQALAGRIKSEPAHGLLTDAVMVLRERRLTRLDTTATKLENWLNEEMRQTAAYKKWKAGQGPRPAPAQVPTRKTAKKVRATKRTTEKLLSVLENLDVSSLEGLGVTSYQLLSKEAKDRIARAEMDEKVWLQSITATLERFAEVVGDKLPGDLRKKWAEELADPEAWSRAHDNTSNVNYWPFDKFGKLFAFTRQQPVTMEASKAVDDGGKKRTITHSARLTVDENGRILIQHSKGKVAFPYDFLAYRLDQYRRMRPDYKPYELPSPRMGRSAGSQDAQKVLENIITANTHGNKEVEKVFRSEYKLIKSVTTKAEAEVLDVLDSLQKFNV